MAENAPHQFTAAELYEILLAARPRDQEESPADPSDLVSLPVCLWCRQPSPEHTRACPAVSWTGPATVAHRLEADR